MSPICRAALGLLLFVGLLGLGCGRPTARVEEPVGADWRAVALELKSMEGGRDGYHTHLNASFTGPGGGMLELKLSIVVDPQASLESGTWTYDGPVGPASGSVLPEHIQFAGGQGDGVSVGGSYLLQSDGVTRFRVSLPLQTLAGKGWK